ncbi:uncharacterized protein LOC123318416 [Coccinella septempunctata]|uniref:uncharacterized protein LOC123318416 n=1 Tax=Coccinella septempunctata TaxID=41139 RepID=UPI001D091683|nr:uncharacterized protein LOC123318416 [Coccinella septempunctata]
MYTSYVLKGALFLTVIFCSFCADCVHVRQNCTGCRPVSEEKSRSYFADEDGPEETLENGGNHYTGSTDNDTIPNIQDGPENNWEIKLTDTTGLSIRKHQDELTLQITKLSGSVEARKKKMSVMDVIPYLIIPGFISAGILPWLIPGMKIAVMGVAMINQMAFTSSLFSLIRGYIFDTSQEDHIVYVNHGYEKYKHQKHGHGHR